MLFLQILPLKISKKTESRYLKDTDSRQIHRITFTTFFAAAPRPKGDSLHIKLSERNGKNI